MTMNKQTAIEDQALQTIWSIQTQLKALTDLVDQHDQELRSAQSFVVGAFEGWPVLNALDAVKELETALMDAKFEKIGEAAYFPQETAK